MSKIYELFGYPLDDRSKEAETSRQEALCPFMQARCDGGGNRYQSRINLIDDDVSDEMRQYFAGLDVVQSGVCSLQLQPDTSPWIVCPRRLFTFGLKGKEAQPHHQSTVLSNLLKYSGFNRQDRIGVWSEAWIRYTENSDDEDEDTGEFNYRFDYVLMRLDTITHHEACQKTSLDWTSLKPVLKKSGYTIRQKGTDILIDNFPVDSPLIIEVMTSSTSGGNKRKRTTIPMAFEDAVIGKPHRAPTINRRQVWARMVSQLIVKSQVGMAWGGRTVWIVQDNLVDYIQTTTGLDLYQFMADDIDEVNMLSFSYDDYRKNAAHLIELDLHGLFSGPIKPEADGKTLASFQDIIQIGTIPPLHVLIEKLIHTKASIITV